MVMKEFLLVFPIYVKFSKWPKPVAKQPVVNFDLFQGETKNNLKQCIYNTEESSVEQKLSEAQYLA